MKLLSASYKSLAETSFVAIIQSRGRGPLPYEAYLSRQAARLSSTLQPRSCDSLAGSNLTSYNESDKPTSVSIRRARDKSKDANFHGHSSTVEREDGDSGSGGASATKLFQSRMKTSKAFKRIYLLTSSSQDVGDTKLQEQETKTEESILDNAAGWAMRIDSQLDTSVQSAPHIRFTREQVQTRRLLTRTERRNLAQLANSLNEVIDFEKAIKAQPWRPEELANGEQCFHELGRPEAQEAAKYGDKEDSESSFYTALFSTTTGRRLSHYSVLAAFIDLEIRKPVLTTQQYDGLLLELFSDDTLLWLEGHGEVTPEDIIAWAWILRAESDYAAVSQFLVWTNQPLPRIRAPRIIFYMLLKRNPYPEPRVVQMLTKHLAHRLENTIDPEWAVIWERFHGHMVSEEAAPQEPKTANYATLNPWQTAIYLLRLIKFSSYSIPILLPHLATLMCKNIQPQLTGSSWSEREDGLTSRSGVNLTLVLNKALVIMARTSAEPFVNVPYQERAQFVVVRYMNKFRPALAIGLEAYRAIVSVQLRHRKTIKERLWAELKSRAWPPYREDKLGIDALKKDEDYGISRAQHALINMKEAGFSPTEWEESASVLSGWDVNKTPTIQSRRIFLQCADTGVKRDIRLGHGSIWRSRILTTRTIEEAWAVFLNYMEENIPRSSEVFLAMFEKIVYERERTAHLNSTGASMSSTVLAGDSPYTLPSSRNPREQVYVPSPAPSFTAFYQRYLTYFHVLNTEAVCFLLPHAESIQQGYDIIEKSMLTEAQKDVLLRTSIVDEDKTPMESRIVVAYIRMLGNFAATALPNHGQVSALSHAIHLIISRKPRSRGPWRAVLKAINEALRDKASSSFWLQHWNIVLGLLQSMKKLGVYHDIRIFHIVCSIFTCLVRYVSHTSPDGQYHRAAPQFESAPEFRARSGRIIKGMFKSLVNLEPQTVLCRNKDELPFLSLRRSQNSALDENSQGSLATLVPHLLYTPSPPTLHIFVRLLGLLEDKKAVYELIRWMAIYHREIEAKSMELARGARQMRYTLIAVRIIMESATIPWMSRRSLPALVGLDLEYAKETKAIMNGVQSWGGWPSDREVESYWKEESVHLNDKEVREQEDVEG